MEPDDTDQQAFDEQVSTNGKLVLRILGGAAIFAAFIMSFTALLVSSTARTTTVTTAAATVGIQPARASAPTTALVAIDHVMHGCHSLAVNGGMPRSPDATLRLAVGGEMVVRNNDVMPHRLIATSGPPLQLNQAQMSHMGASSRVSFPTAGVYKLTTKAGEDYSKGIVTTGADHVLHINVIVS
ncbi:MAG: hypothetical protein QOG68_2732 [Solirubrobacteraceae bacterium]|nr:hypothetical protein [Solirubrobacteraceae bacterium]